MSLAGCRINPKKSVREKLIGQKFHKMGVNAFSVFFCQDLKRHKIWVIKAKSKKEDFFFPQPAVNNTHLSENETCPKEFEMDHCLL